MSIKSQRIIIIFVILLGFFKANSQTIAVKSFRKLETDQDARIIAPKVDQNGKKCAIIKLVTSQSGFVFDFGMIGNALATEQKTGEIWIWVPKGARKVTISHQQLGVLRDYPFEIDIEEATVFEMVLTTGKVVTSVEEEISSQWLVINTEPDDAMVYVNDQFVKNGMYQAKYKPGSYTYRIEASLYHTEAGKIEIVDSKKELNVKLKPAFGYLTVNSEPEQGAKVLIDGKLESKTTPLLSGPLASQEHTVQVIMEMFQPVMQKVTVKDGQTVPINLIMKPNFAELNISAPADANLYINNEQKGSGGWQGRLNAGVYTLEARMENHRSAKKDIDLTIGDKRIVDLLPSPIFGSLDVITIPTGANITINGKMYGTTPSTNKLLIGDYKVQISKQGFASVNKTVTILEGNSTELNETLASGTLVTIKSEPADALLYIDNKLVGSLPYSSQLAFGIHILRLEKGNDKIEKSIEVKQEGEENISLSINANIIEITAGLNMQMINIKGGQFLMGSNEGATDEKPVHKVTVSNFFLGRYEVTQAQWKIIMGENPSGFIGDNLPVENVSRNDVEKFLIRLNSQTGKTYRLPTEAEWEFAAQGGASIISAISRNKWAGTNNDSSLGDYAWYDGNSNKRTHAVGSKRPNELELYDMSGNVMEMCNDRYNADYYAKSPHSNPKGPITDYSIVNRGGSWYDTKQNCRVTFRYIRQPNESSRNLGFRVALSSN